VLPCNPRRSQKIMRTGELLEADVAASGNRLVEYSSSDVGIRLGMDMDILRILVRLAWWGSL
jgi:hypothetical protein